MAKIGLTNLKYSTDGVNYTDIGKPIDAATLEAETTNDNCYEFIKDTNKIDFSINLKLHKKRNGTVLERWLYYHNHKKKRIRKKYRIDKLLIRGGKYGK